VGDQLIVAVFDPMTIVSLFAPVPGKVRVTEPVLLVIVPWNA
jgi:hypothetical protein